MAVCFWVGDFDLSRLTKSHIKTPSTIDLPPLRGSLQRDRHFVTQPPVSLLPLGFPSLSK